MYLRKNDCKFSNDDDEEFHRLLNLVTGAAIIADDGDGGDGCDTGVSTGSNRPRTPIKGLPRSSKTPYHGISALLHLNVFMGSCCLHLSLNQYQAIC
uniref:Uncharacterized protein n=1 Tax=Vespula pensylvanica TaxID=30213 RepID=A0A834KTY6_VESPE|nr:hypothetical protein H0235_012822 [Vespula pensylvanica]